jgi:hypothetical protein
MPRALLHYLAQARIADRSRRPQRDAPTRAANDAATRGHPIASAGSRPWWRARTVAGCGSAR